MNRNFKKVINDLHLWFGLLSGTLLFVICLSGTIYTFHKEIDEFFHQNKYVVKPEAAFLAPEKLVALAEKEGGYVSNIMVPAQRTRSWIFTIKDKEDNKARGRQVLVNPFNGKILGDTKSKTNEFFTTIMKLHRWLLMEQATGRVVVGVVTIIFACMLLSGIILWLPKRWRYWRAGVTIMFSGKWKRINHDLHNTLGFYSFLILLIMALTGLCWSFEWYREGLSTILGEKVFKQRNEQPILSVFLHDKAPMPVSRILEISNIASFNPANTTVNFPSDSAGSFTINKTRAGVFSISVPDKLTVDQYSGTILKHEKFSDKSFPQKIAASIKPLHTGEIFGMLSKILYFICCLIATSLPVTGTIIWINKIRK